VAPQQEAALPRPPKELKGFAKVKLEPGASKQVEIDLRPTALAYYDPTAKKWKTEPGNYEIQVGNSSRNLPLKQTIKMETQKLHDHY
jgi:beta-glucosidase